MDKETALKILRELHDKALFSERTALETLHPELKESEDEKIREALVRFHKSSIDIDGIKGEDILAWLERQGEHKPAENKGMDLVEEEMTPFQKKVFCIVDTAIEEEQGLSNICNELLALAIQEIEQKPAWSEEDDAYKLFAISAVKDYYDKENPLQKNLVDWLKSLKDRIGG